MKFVQKLLRKRTFSNLLAGLVNTERLFTMKPCVACAEEIKSEAVLCRFCGTRQDSSESSGTQTQAVEVIDKRRVDPSTGDIRPEVTASSPSSVAPGSSGGGCLKPTLWIVGAIVLLSIIFSFFSDGGTAGAGAAKVACHNTVKSALKAPSTARFSSTVSKHNTRENDFLVEGTVDAENSFGARIRSSFQCVVDTSGSSPRVTLNYLG